MAEKRKSIGARLRFDVFKRDGFVCQYCGAHPPEALLHVDHIHPVSEGGLNEVDNLITSCDRCNLGKGANLLSSTPKSIDQRAEEMAEREAQVAAYSALMQSIRDRIEDECWQVAEILKPGASDGYSQAKFSSIKKFVTEMGLHACLDAAEIACAKKPYSIGDRFQYFCGICWRKLERGDF